MRKFAALTLLLGLLGLARPAAALAQGAPKINPGFLGSWCVQGDPSRQASIVPSGLGLQLTNETGSTSVGQVLALSSSTIVALQWDLVQGTLTKNGRRIDWSNDTFWSRCITPNSDTLDGTWYAAGDPSRQCSIRQRFGGLNFRNETGAVASGAFDGPMHFRATWSGIALTGAISNNGRRIDWSNGTFWTRQ